MAGGECIIIQKRSKFKVVIYDEALCITKYKIIGGKGKSGRKQGSKQNGEDEGKQIDADNGSTYDFIDGVTGCV